MPRGGMNPQMPMGQQFQGQQPRMPYPGQMAPQMRQPFPQQFQGGVPQGPVIAFPQVDLSEYHSLTDLNEKKNFIGNHIYPSIEQAFGANAGKITGMLLDEKAVNIDNLLQDPAYLNSKVVEAY
jgi:hypothetical protein